MCPLNRTKKVVTLTYRVRIAKSFQCCAAYHPDVGPSLCFTSHK